MGGACWEGGEGASSGGRGLLGAEAEPSFWVVIGPLEGRGLGAGSGESLIFLGGPGGGRRLPGPRSVASGLSAALSARRSRRRHVVLQLLRGRDFPEPLRAGYDL